MDNGQQLDPAQWPNAATSAQGWLAGRWQRRDGDIYGATGVARAGQENSPIAGGPDAGAKVDVPSGAPKVAHADD